MARSAVREDALPHGSGERLPIGISRLETRGYSPLLERRFTALFCSLRPPPDLVLPALDLARTFRRAEVPVISGFHSPVERGCLEILLTGKQPIAVCLPRSIQRMRIPPEWRTALAERRLIVASGAGFREERPTARSAELRNRLVAALADRVVIVHASAGGRLYGLAREVVRSGKPLLCLDHPSNGDLLLLGARTISPSR